jgi:hypothetical protein
MWHRIIRQEIPGILKDCFTFKTSGTTHPKTQVHIPQGMKLLQFTFQMMDTQNKDHKLKHLSTYAE